MTIERCPHCGSEDIYFSKKRRVFLCEDCERSFGAESGGTPSLRLFFSYGHDGNAELVDRLRADLEARGHAVWMDTSKIRTGDDWRRAITAGLMDANTVLTFLSKHSVRVPGVCLDELRIALCVKSAAIRTVLLESESEVAAPSTLSSVQWLDMSSWRQRWSEDPANFESWYAENFAELCRVIESDESIAFSGEITALRRLLTPNLSDTKEAHLLRQDYVGREWLDNELERWRVEDRDSKAFLLYGGPGLGKSRYAAQRLHYDPNILCAVFCEWDKESLRDVNGVISTLAFKLATKLPEYRKILLASLDGVTSSQLRRLSDAELFESVLTYPLSQVIDGGRPRQLMLIDGLDEAEVDGVNYLAHTLAEQMQNLPSWIGLVLTSRPESSVRGAFAGYAPHELRSEDGRNMQDIRDYLMVALREWLSDEPDKLGALDRIVRATEGNFLYATLLVANIAQFGLDVAADQHLPQGLSGFYLQNFRRRFPSPGSFVPVREAMELVVAAPAVPIALTRDLLGLNAYGLREFLDSCGTLVLKVNTPDADPARVVPTLALCHKSLADWLDDADQSGRYYVDRAAGLRRLARFAYEYFELGADRAVSAEYAAEETKPYHGYLQRNITTFLAEAGLWSELETFLLDDRTPLHPYWLALAAFPDEYNRDRLLERIWRHPVRDAFVRRLQREGARTFVSHLMQWLVQRFGIEELGPVLVNVYVDVVHMSGAYPQAVEICDELLARTSESELLQDHQMLRLAIRRLHHSMFFKPVDALIDAAHQLIAKLDAHVNPDEYNELLFLIGGNLGLLSGDFESARPWLDRSLAFAQDRGSLDFEQRSLRKHADLLCLDGRFDEAHELVTGLVRPGREVESRYQIYLLGTLGETARHRRSLAESAQAYETLRDLSTVRGIPGWQAHAQLGMAALLRDFDQLEDALDLVSRAEAIYKRISMAWGEVAVEVVRSLIEQRATGPNNRELRDRSSAGAARATSMQYRYEAGILEAVAEGRPVDTFHLLYL